ncbi:hypothetical protein CFP56_033160 [Quercus suber]|uniref:Uncharacterized protein n=1 Tax=Quercus suber TaxID=58331 RepID=A0AAW0MAU8_QUESU
MEMKPKNPIFWRTIESSKLSYQCIVN